ncbi:MAG TPA: alanine racemase [Stellaceae bacterium]|jgi:alanine racemase|nr:alanine racemase [Stellaceae bacterium]
MTTDPTARAGAILEIDLGAIVANWRKLAGRAAPALCAAVVKAGAYGLGAAPVARALAAAGCRMFFVATLDEGIALRQTVGKAPEIAVLNGPFPGTAPEFTEYGLIPVLNEPGQIAEWRRLGGRPAAILHVDTGMARLGLSAREFITLIENPPPIAWRVVMSHLACADEPDHAMNERQRTRFAAAAVRLPGVAASLAASSGIFLGPDYHFDIVRPGAALYGVNPQPGRPNPLRPVVRLSGKILQIRQIDSGESVGYGAAHVMQAPGRAAVVALGYADGWLRSLSHRGCGYLAGMRVPLLGRVSMDLVTFDVTAIPPALARPGVTIELLGSDYGVDDAAADAGTIGYEILTALGSRYHRVYRDPPDVASSE